MKYEKVLTQESVNEFIDKVAMYILATIAILVGLAFLMLVVSLFITAIPVLFFYFGAWDIFKS